MNNYTVKIGINIFKDIKAPNSERAKIKAAKIYYKMYSYAFRDYEQVLKRRTTRIISVKKTRKA